MSTKLVTTKNLTSYLAPLGAGGLPQFHGVRYVAYGHSFGQVVDVPNVWPGSLYPARLRDLLHADPDLYANRCVSGSIMWQIAAHLDETWAAGDHGLVSVMGGQNDIGMGHSDPAGPPAYADALRYFLTKLQAGTVRPTVVVIKATTSTPAGYALYSPPPTNADVATYNALTDQVVAEFPRDGSIVVADPLADGWRPETMTCRDGLHPNDRGQAHIAASVLKALDRAPYRVGLNL